MALRDDIDFPRSRAILLGTSVYTAGFGSTPMPAASNSLAAMRAALTGPCGWPGSRIEEFADKSNRDFVPQKLAPLIHETQDVLLFYYVGHGQLLVGNDLGLALTDTSEDPKLRLATSLRLSQLRLEMEHNCDARIRILILDCCCSGIATKYSQGPDNLAAQVHQAASLEGEGTYTWTACGHSQDTFFEPGRDGLTYFTKFLTETAHCGIGSSATPGLTVAALNREVKRRIQQASLPGVLVKPEPSLLFHGPADEFVFVRNAAPANLARSGVYSLRAGARLPEWRPWISGSHGPIDSSASLSNGVVYYGSQDCCLYARDNITGKLLWQFRSGKPIRSSPAIVVDTVYFGSDDGHLYALEVGTGKVRWSFRTARLIRSSPAVAGGIVYVGSGRHLYALDAATGKRRWRYSTDDWVCSSPAVSGDSIYVGSDDGSLHAIHAATGTPEWRFDTGKPVRSSPAVSGDSIYVGSDDGSLHAIHAATGTPEWRFDTGGRVYSSPAVVDGIVYVGSQDHLLYALDAGTGQRLWSFKSNGEVDSSPAADETAVYVGSDDGYLYAFGAATGFSELCKPNCKVGMSHQVTAAARVLKARRG